MMAGGQGERPAAGDSRVAAGGEEQAAAGGDVSSGGNGVQGQEFRILSEQPLHSRYITMYNRTVQFPEVGRQQQAPWEGAGRSKHGGVGVLRAACTGHPSLASLSTGPSAGV